jgi:hypothetical protein
MDKHGITGPATTNCGIMYGKNAKGCVHLVWDGINTIHFTYKKRVKQITIEAAVFTPIFTYTGAIYSVAKTRVIWLPNLFFHLKINGKINCMD